MTRIRLHEEEVVASNHALPPFPKVIQKILQSLDDPDASISLLADYVEHDPVLTGLVLSLANRAGNLRAGGAVHDVFTAISLVGLARVREICEVAGIASFTKGWVPDATQRSFWAHSIAVAACAVEIVHGTPVEVGVDDALIAGLMHNVGQLWLQRFHAKEMDAARNAIETTGADRLAAERDWFGVDHGTVGGWLAQSWGVPANVTAAICHHREPDGHLNEPLVAVAHLAEVLCNALDLTNSGSSKVTRLSRACVDAVGLDLDGDLRSLFSRIEARNQFSRSMFDR